MQKSHFSLGCAGTLAPAGYAAMQSSTAAFWAFVDLSMGAGVPAAAAAVPMAASPVRAEESTTSAFLRAVDAAQSQSVAAAQPALPAAVSLRALWLQQSLRGLEIAVQSSRPAKYAIARGEQLQGPHAACGRGRAWRNEDQRCCVQFWRRGELVAGLRGCCAERD
jgi:hypothetical protein